MRNFLINHLTSYLSLILSAFGMIIMSQSISFAWYRKDSLDFSSHVQSVCLFLAGVALILISLFAQLTFAKLLVLEKELKELRAQKST
jgi:hypothetical protein